VTVVVLKPGLETTIQDYPGRIGMLQHGVPSSGPLDDWSFRLANLLVGNRAGDCAVECQFLGPELQFDQQAVISVCGADLLPMLDGRSVPLWTSVQVQQRQTLTFGVARTGARAYLAISGGIEVPTVMGARATYVTAALGGIEGGPLKAGQVLRIGNPRSEIKAGRTVKSGCTPQIASSKKHSIGVVHGPKDDWVSEEGKSQFFAATWVLSSRSNRVGFRIQGPQIAFSRAAYDKDPANGDHPSNIIDMGYPIGGINWAGDTPTILMHDCLTLGGFIVPFTVPSCEFWKLAQARPNDVLHFFPTSVEDSQIARKAIDGLCTPNNILE
jgi:5-oxoprolinase (ATP-hydrolysing) subunit C